MTRNREEKPAATSRRAVWAAGLVVAAGAGVATAHGLYEVATAAQVPPPIAWLYPLITDGLALVAYAASSRLDDGGRRYAATIGVLAACLSGLAQAVYLAGGIVKTTAAPVGLRFGVGAWPAIAAAVTAHLLHLIATRSTAAVPEAVHQPGPGAVSNAPSVQPYNPASNPNAVQPDRSTPRPESGAVPAARSTDPDPSNPPATDAERSGSRGVSSPASERARAAARHHHARNGRLPTVTELARMAGVARGTAGSALKDLRENRPALHVVNIDADQETDQ
jgi:hypothetical protein